MTLLPTKKPDIAKSSLIDFIKESKSIMFLSSSPVSDDS